MEHIRITASPERNPFMETPPLWQFNKQFLQLAGNLDRFWESQGIEWRFGVEHEFKIGCPGDENIRRYITRLNELIVLEASTGQAQPDGLSLPRHRQNRTLLKGMREHKQDAIRGLRDTYGVIIGECEPEIRTLKNARQSPAGPTLREELSHMQAILAKRQTLKQKLIDHIRQNTGYSEGEKAEKIKEIGKNTFKLRDCLMTAMQEIWLHDELEYRFGKKDGGRGFYDAPGTSEVRTHPKRLEGAIRDFHQVIATINRAAQDYGVNIRHLLNQHIHVSAHVAGTESKAHPYGIPLTYLSHKDERTVTYSTRRSQTDPLTVTRDGFYRRAVEGLYTLMADGQLFWEGYPDISAGSGRGSVIRVMQDQFELRRTPKKSEGIDLPMSLAMILAGVTHGLTDREQRRALSERHFRQGHFYVPDTLPAKTQEVAKVLAHALDESLIGRIGNFLPDSHYLSYMFRADPSLIPALTDVRLPEDHNKITIKTFRDAIDRVIEAMSDIRLHQENRTLHYHCSNLHIPNPAVRELIEKGAVRWDGTIFPTIHIPFDTPNPFWNKTRPDFLSLPEDATAMEHRFAALQRLAESPAYKNIISAEWLPEYPDFFRDLQACERARIEDPENFERWPGKDKPCNRVTDRQAYLRSASKNTASLPGV